jgi:hypothetical protein
MRLRSRVWLIGLITLGATPLAAQAGGSQRAADACIQAFVDTYLPKDREVQVRKLPPIPSTLSVYVRRYTIDLSARLSRDEVINARCVASPSGKVILLDSSTTDTAPSTGIARL